MDIIGLTLSSESIHVLGTAFYNESGFHSDWLSRDDQEPNFERRTPIYVKRKGYLIAKRPIHIGYCFYPEGPGSQKTCFKKKRLKKKFTFHIGSLCLPLAACTVRSLSKKRNAFMSTRGVCPHVQSLWHSLRFVVVFFIVDIVVLI